MKLAVDVHYSPGTTVTGGVVFGDWYDSRAAAVYRSLCREPEAYVPGRFFRRELPCILHFLGEHALTPEMIVVDGFVYLDGERVPGLGKHLFDALGHRIPLSAWPKSGLPRLPIHSRYTVAAAAVHATSPVSACHLSDYGVRVSLPTEAQWERAARGADAHEYPWGKGEIDPEKANYYKTGIGTTSPVGCFPRGSSPEGVFDLAGNVLEWCEDWYRKDIGHRVSDPSEPSDGSCWVLRGGAWDIFAENCRTALRNRSVPDSRYDGVGFRLVRLPGQLGEQSQSRRQVE